MVLARAVEQTSTAFVHAVVPRDESVSFTSLFVQVAGGAAKHFTFTAAFELAQYLIVPLPAHHDLTVNVLNIHVLSAVASIRAHQASLVGDSSLYVIDSSRSGCLLERAGCDVSVGSLLDAVD